MKISAFLKTEAQAFEAGDFLNFLKVFGVLRLIFLQKYFLYKKTRVDQDTIPTKPTKTTDSWTNTDISNNKTDHSSQDGNSLIIGNFITPVKK